MNFKSLEQKCLHYRSLTDYSILPNSNVIAMVDGRSFSKLVKKRFALPFDEDFVQMMNETAKYVCSKIQGCKIAYVQSDEISFLITDYDTPDTDSFFGYRLCKMESIIASLATAKFNQVFINYLIEKEIATRNDLPNEIDGRSDIVVVRDVLREMNLAQFDCKVWPVPSSNDAFAWFLYRQIDCIRNSKQQAAQTFLPHDVLKKHTTDVQIEMLKDQKGVDWHEYPDKYKFGRFVHQTTQHMSKEIKGEVHEFDRNVWVAMPGFQLTEEGGKERFYDLVPVLKLR